MWLENTIKDINEDAEKTRSYQGLDTIFDIAMWCEIQMDKAEEAGDTRKYNDYLYIYQKAYAGIGKAGYVATKAFTYYCMRFEDTLEKDVDRAIEEARLALIKDAKLTDSAGL